MLIVWLLTTVVVGAMLGPTMNVRPPMTACEGPTEKVKPPAVTVEREGGGVGMGMVVPANATPFGPILIVVPW
jgi:hypothetical protein